MELIDTHLHLIWRDRFGYSWTKDIPQLCEGDFSLAMARGLYGGEVIGSIFMEVGVDDADYKAEGRYVARFVKDGSLLGQIVSCRPESDPEFAAWVEECADLGVVGFRRILHVVPDDVSFPESFRENIRLIGRAGKPFDMNFWGRTLPNAAALAGACPGTPMVLDHCGTPDIAAGAFDEWLRGLKEVAARDNVLAVKMSGIAAYAAPGTATFETLAPWLDAVLDTFGPDRMVWGSDWPVVNLGGGLPGWIGISRAWMGQRLSPDEAARVGRLNAERIYGVRAG